MLAVGDFNCDGKPDYAITELNRDSALAKAVLAAEATPLQITAAQSEQKTYAWDRAAEVRVALSTAKDFLWLKEKGSYIANSGKEPTGCAGSPTPKAIKAQERRMRIFIPRLL